MVVYSTRGTLPINKTLNNKKRILMKILESERESELYTIAYQMYNLFIYLK